MISTERKDGTPAALVRHVRSLPLVVASLLGVAGCIQSPQPSPTNPEATPARTPIGCDRLGTLVLDAEGRVALGGFARSNDPNAFFTVIPFDRPGESFDVAESAAAEGLPIAERGTTRLLYAAEGALAVCDVRIVDERVDYVGLRPDCFVPDVSFGCQTDGDGCRAEVILMSFCGYDVEVRAIRVLQNAEAITVGASAPLRVESNDIVTIPVDVRLGSADRVDTFLSLRLAFLDREFEWPVTVRATRR